MAAPTLMDIRAFKTATDIGIFRGRKSLEKIDTALGLCAGLDGKPADRRLALMVNLIEACNEWLTKKALKSSSSKDGETANTAKRRKQVELLMGQAQKRFAWERFEQKKERSRRLSAVPPLLQGLQGGYRPERTQFLAHRTAMRDAKTYLPGATISPVGGSHIHAVHESAHQGKLTPIAKEFADFTMEDYLAYKATDYPSHGCSLVHYMRKEERLEKMLIVKEGLLYTPKGVLYNTPGRPFMYVMDQYGNLFVQNHGESGRTAPQFGHKAEEPSQYNHSSLNAGNDVMCAGTIGIESGVLNYISNESGHYAPTPQHLAGCLRSLIEDGVNTSSTEVWLLTATNRYGPWTVTVFLDNPDACLAAPPTTRERRRGMILPAPIVP